MVCQRNNDKERVGSMVDRETKLSDLTEAAKERHRRRADTNG